VDKVEEVRDKKKNRGPLTGTGESLLRREHAEFAWKMNRVL
jgi:hypothetical protein